jgi:hypothetical protein
MSDSEIAPTQMLKVARDPLVDTIIGERYRILGRIGEGGMGTVFRVEHTLMKKVLALKLLRAEFSNVPDAARRFEREAQSASRLNHPNIISVTDFGHGAGGELFLVMEFVAGEPLAEVLLREGRLEPGAPATSRARSCSPSNTRTSRASFTATSSPPTSCWSGSGSAQTRDGEDPGFRHRQDDPGPGHDEPLTRGMMIFGTPATCRPNRPRGKEADSRADLYSCGIILYEMLVGRSPSRIPTWSSCSACRSRRRRLVSPRWRPMRAFRRPWKPWSCACWKRSATSASQRDRVSRGHRNASTDAAELGARFAASSVRMGFTLGAKLWAKRPWSSRPASGCGPRVRGQRQDRRTRASGAQAPARETAALRRAGRRRASAAGAALRARGGRKGASPKLEPPKPKPVAAEMKSPIKHIEETMAKGLLTEARVLIMQQISAHPSDGRVRYLLGNLEFADKNPSAGLQAYERRFVSILACAPMRLFW